MITMPRIALAVTLGFALLLNAWPVESGYYIGGASSYSQSMTVGWPLKCGDLVYEAWNGGPEFTLNSTADWEWKHRITLANQYVWWESSSGHHTWQLGKVLVNLMWWSAACALVVGTFRQLRWRFGLRQLLWLQALVASGVALGMGAL